MKPGQGAVVVFSGGQDSTTCLYWALREFSPVAALSFSYGQRHHTELQAAAAIAERANVSCRVQKLALDPCALTTDGGADLAGNYSYLGLPSALVPGRNAVFLMFAALEAYRLGVHHIVGGMYPSAFGGYPDDRRATIDALQNTLTLALEYPLFIHTPLMYRTKAEIVKLARSLPECWGALALTVTCYQGMRPGCGKCTACVARAQGFREADLADPAWRWE